MIFLLLCVFYLHHLESIDSSCLHKGCVLSNGMRADELNTTLKEILPNNHDQENILRVAQWNILYDKHDIGLDNWNLRKEEVCIYLKKLNPTVFGLQEVQQHQLNFLRNCLADYSYFGLPREDGLQAQYNPVIIKKSDRIKVLDSGTFWLSKTPNKKGSMLQSAKEARICSWVQFRYKYKTTDGIEWRTIYFATTHLAWREEGLAAQQLSILLQNLRSMSSTNNDLSGHQPPMILTGDFNWEDNSSMYKTMTSSKIFSNTMFNSTKIFPAYTALPPYDGIKDYIWQNGFQSVLSATMMDTRQNGRFLSDHRTVVAILLVK